MTISARRGGELLAMLRRNPGFTRLYGAQLVSFMGDWFAFVALQAMVLELTGRPALAGLMLMTHLLPTALLSPLAGVVVDRVDRRTVMIVADVLRALLALGPLLVRDASTLWIAFVAMGLLSSISAFFDPASSAALPNLVRDDDLPLANVLMGSAWGTMLAIGAALGGVVAATFGREAAFLGDAASFVVSALLLATIRERFHAPDRAPRAARVSVVADVAETFRFAKADRRVLALLLVKGGFGVGSGVIALISVMVLDVFERGEAALGIVMSGRGLGALVGPFLFRRLFRPLDQRLFPAIAAAFVLFSAGYLLFAVSPGVAVATLATTIAHLGGGAQWTLSTYGLQRFTPDHIRGRIFSFDYGFVTLTLAGSAALAGALAGVFDTRVVAAGFAALSLAWAGTWTFGTRRWWTREEPAARDTR